MSGEDDLSFRVIRLAPRRQICFGEERTGILGSLLAFLSLDREYQLRVFINLPNLLPKHILSNIRW